MPKPAINPVAYGGSNQCAYQPSIMHTGLSCLYKCQLGLMNLKERFESHPVPFGLGLIVMGFVAGFGARGYLLPSTAGTIVTNCNVDGVASLTKAHNERLQALQKTLTTSESEATNMGHLESNQQIYRDSADRVRKDIAQEVSAFQAAVSALSNKCSR